MVIQILLKSANNIYFAGVLSAFDLFRMGRFMNLREGSIVNMIFMCFLLLAVVNVVSLGQNMY